MKPHKDCRKKRSEKGGYIENIRKGMSKETFKIFLADLAFFKEDGITREMLKDDAKGGDVTAAWMVGVGNKFRVVSDDNCPIARNPKAKDKGKIAGIQRLLNGSNKLRMEAINKQ